MRKNDYENAIIYLIGLVLFVAVLGMAGGIIGMFIAFT